MDLQCAAKRVLRGGAALALGLALTACRQTQPSPSGFYNYVALGDSLSAGMQAIGLTPQNQRAAFPVLLARMAGIPFEVAEGAEPGCPPAFGKGVRITSCLRANPFVPSSNFAVPGARVYDLAHSSSQNVISLYKPLYSLLLGPVETQVDAALLARPRFITLWAGANDALGSTLQGDPSRATAPEAFAQSYAEVLDKLAPLRAHIILITVPDVTLAPALLPGPELARQGLAAPDCLHSPNRVSLTLLFNPRFSKPLSCGAPYALTPAELAQARDTVKAYNNIIVQLGGRYGCAVFDADELQREVKLVPYDPGAAEPFGPDFSGDGIHPSSRAYARVALHLARFINASFGTHIPLSPPS